MGRSQSGMHSNALNMKAIKFIILSFFLIIQSCSNNYVELEMSTREKANQTLKEMITESDTPGLQYIFVNADSNIFEFNGGLSNLESKTKLTPTTTFNTFSVTKTFTALAILHLEENNKLNIDDNVQDYLDYLPYKTNFTIRQVLNHTSGLPNPLPSKWAHLITEHESFDYKQFVENVLSENDELDNDPGEKHSYSNIDYLILGEIIAKVSGEDYRTYIQRNIIQKLNLSKDEQLDFEIPDTLQHAHGYIWKWSLLNFGLNFVFDKGKFMQDSYDGWTQFNFYYMNGYPFGGLIGNARGFASYLQAMLKSKMLISNHEKLKLFEIQKTNNKEFIDQTLGWYRGTLLEDTYYAHAGGGGGYYCKIRLYLDREMASVIMFNRTGVSDERFMDNIDKLFL